MPRASRLTPLAFAAIVTLGACGSDEDGAAEQPPSTPAAGPTTSNPITSPTSAPNSLPSSSPTTMPSVPSDQRYELISSVIEDAYGPRLCFNVLDSLPPQCGTGLALNHWSWDDITVEQAQNDVTWVDGIYLAGSYDAAAETFTVDTAGIPTDEDRERLLLSRPMPDFSVPCTPPAAGWPVRNGTDWPIDAIRGLDGYAGSWVDDSEQVLTVKFTGDPTAAESAVREHYADALCVTGADRSQAELSAIQQQLLGMSSTQLVGTAIYVDASGEWVEAMTIAPDAERQAALDAEFGEGVVRLQPTLHPVATT